MLELISWPYLIPQAFNKGSILKCWVSTNYQKWGREEGDKEHLTWWHVNNSPRRPSLCTVPSLLCTVTGHGIFQHLGFFSSNSAFVFPWYLFSWHGTNIPSVPPDTWTAGGDWWQSQWMMLPFPVWPLGFFFPLCMWVLISACELFNCKSPAVLILLLSR